MDPKQIHYSEVVLICSLKRFSRDVSDPHDARFYNIILEEEALKIEPCTDENLSASVKHSSLSFIGEYYFE
jgi:hypothetical protein